MAKVYTQKRFNNPETTRVNLTAAITGGIGATGNIDFNDVVDVGRADVGAVVKVTSAGVGSILADKTSVDLSDGNMYYLLAEVPISVSTDDFHFVGVFLKNQYDVDNLIESPAGNRSWAKQYYELRNSGVR